MVHWTEVFKKVDLIQHLFARRCVGIVRQIKLGSAQVFLQRTLASVRPELCGHLLA
jgi:hypothetical protein